MPISQADLERLKKRLDEHVYDAEEAARIHASLPEIRDDVDVIATVIPKRRKGKAPVDKPEADEGEVPITDQDVADAMQAMAAIPTPDLPDDAMTRLSRVGLQDLLGQLQEGQGGFVVVAVGPDPTAGYVQVAHYLDSDDSPVWQVEARGEAKTLKRLGFDTATDPNPSRTFDAPGLVVDCFIETLAAGFEVHEGSQVWITWEVDKPTVWVD